MSHEKHPIDDLFQRGLSQHSVPPPMHVWERIEESRGARHRGKLVVIRQKFTIASGAAAVLLLGLWLAWPPNPNLGSFPLAASLPTDEIQEQPSRDNRLELPEQQASLIPSVEDLLFDEQQADLPVEVPAERTAFTGNPDQVADPLPQVTEPDPDRLAENVLLSEHLPPGTKVKSAATSLNISPLEVSRLENLPGGLTTLDVKPLPVPETGCARFSDGRPALFFALTAGPAFSSRKFSPKSDEYEDYAAERAHTESVRLSYGAGARLSMVFPWGGAIRGGLDYTNLKEQLVYKNSKVRQTTITEIYGPNGQVIGIDTTYITDTTILKYNNRYRLLDIPIQLGYEVRYDKVTIAANVGLNINIAHSNEGNYLSNQDLLPTRFDSDDPDAIPVYKTKLGLGWQASMGFYYQLNDRLDLMAEPYLRYYPKTFTRNDYPLDQKYLVGGLGLGLRVLL